MDLDTVTLWETVHNITKFEKLCYEDYKKNGTSKYRSYSIVGNIDIPFNYTDEEWNLLVDDDRGLVKSTGKNEFKKEQSARYKEAGYNDENTRLPAIMDTKFSTIFQEFADKMGLKHWYSKIHVQKPGQMVPNHVDTMRSWTLKFPDLAKIKTHSEVPRFLILLSDWNVGHFFSVGDRSVIWKKGDILTCDHRMPHATANAGFSNKIIALIEGC